MITKFNITKNYQKIKNDQKTKNNQKIKNDQKTKIDQKTKKLIQVQLDFKIFIDIFEV